MLIYAAVAAIASWSVDWPPSPSRGLASSPSIPVPALAAYTSCKMAAYKEPEGSSGWGDDENETTNKIEVLPIPQPPRQVTHMRGGNGYVDPLFNDTDWWSPKTPPPVVPKGVQLDWISTRPRMFLWRGFASRMNAVELKRLLLTPDMDQYHQWNRHRDQWRIPLGKVPVIDEWTKHVRALWPSIKYERGFVTVMRSPPGSVAVEEHYDNHVASAILYLSNAGDSGGLGTDEGGWTSFPLSGAGPAKAGGLGTKAELLQRSTGRGGILQPRCSEGLGLQIAPHVGMLVGFYNYYPNSSMDISSGHASCPTTTIDKWVVTWFFGAAPEKYFGRELDPV